MKCNQVCALVDFIISLALAFLDSLCHIRKYICFLEKGSGDSGGSEGAALPIARAAGRELEDKSVFER